MAIAKLKEVQEFYEWKQRCVEVSKNLGLSLEDMWDESDPYDLKALLHDAWTTRQSAEDFIREAFAEDLARLEGDEADFETSLDEEE